MKTVALTLLALVCAVSLAVAGAASTFPLASGPVALTNSQGNSSWAPVAVLWTFPSATNAQLTVSRKSQGQTAILGRLSATNATSAIWLPDAEYPFDLGDCLTVSSSASNGLVQIIRKGLK